MSTTTNETSAGEHRIVFSRHPDDYVLLHASDSREGVATAFALIWAQIKRGGPSAVEVVL